MALTLEIELPPSLAQFRLPNGLAARLKSLLDKQDEGHPLTDEERSEAEGLVDVAEFLTLLRLRSERLAS